MILTLYCKQTHHQVTILTWLTSRPHNGLENVQCSWSFRYWFFLKVSADWRRKWMVFIIFIQYTCLCSSSRSCSSSSSSGSSSIGSGSSSLFTFFQWAHNIIRRWMGRKMVVTWGNTMFIFSSYPCVSLFIPPTWN